MNACKMLATLMITAVACGGCSLISVQNFGPEKVTGTTLNEIIEQNGAPDIIGGTNDYIVLGYTHTKGIQVLGIFGSVEKTTTGIVCDRSGKVISIGTPPPGKALTILGGWTSPVVVVED